MTNDVSQWAGNAANRDNCIVASVGGLNCPTDPSDISGFVTNIIVDSVERQPVRAFSRIGKKINERMPPFLADNNTALSVILERFVARIMTARKHVAPRSIRSCVLSFLGVSVDDDVWHSSSGISDSRVFLICK